MINLIQILGYSSSAQHSNNATKQPDDAGQLINYCSSDMLPNDPPSQTHADETPIFRLVWMVCGIIASFDVYFWDTFFIFFHAFARSFHILDIRAERYFSVRTEKCPYKCM